jgi:hypothetical protein
VNDEKMVFQNKNSVNSYDNDIFGKIIDNIVLDYDVED